MLRDLGCCLPPSVWPRPSVSLVSCPNKIGRLVLLARFPAGVFGSVTLSTLLARFFSNVLLSPWKWLLPWAVAWVGSCRTPASLGSVAPASLGIFVLLV